KTQVNTAIPNETSTLELAFEVPAGHTDLPKGSPFPDWQTARRFAGPMPFTFSPERDGSFVVIEGSRQDWVPRPIHIKKWKVSLFDLPPLRGVEPILANAFSVTGVSYRWKRGQIVRPRIIS